MYRQQRRKQEGKKIVYKRKENLKIAELII